MAGVYDEDCRSLPIAQQIARIYEKQLESYFFPGDKTCGQAFLHLDDLVDCCQHVIQRRKRLSPSEVLVIGEEDLMSYEELQEELGKMIHGKGWPAIRIPKAAAKVGAWVKDQLSRKEEQAPFIKPWMIDLADQNYPVDIRRARDQLDWAPTHTLRRTLPEMIRRMRQDPAGWYEANGLPIPEQL
jgi:nucleoside-diphosphate-sugar epimerase